MDHWHLQPLKLLRELTLSPAVAVYTLKLFWGFLDVFAPSLFSRSSPDWRSKTLQHVSIWEQPTISPSVTTALSNIFSPSWCILCLLKVCPLAFSKWHSSVQQCWDTCICGVSKSLLPPRFFLLSLMVPRGLKKKQPKACYNASMVTKISGVGENAIEIVVCFTVWMMLWAFSYL